MCHSHSPNVRRKRLFCKSLLPELSTLLAASAMASAASSGGGARPESVSLELQLALLDRSASWFAGLEPQLELAPAGCVRLALHRLLRRYLFAYLFAELRGACHVYMSILVLMFDMLMYTVDLIKCNTMCCRPIVVL